MHDVNLDDVWQQGYDAAFAGSKTISQCPYRDMRLKRAWVLGFIDGLKYRWTQNKDRGR